MKWRKVGVYVGSIAFLTIVFSLCYLFSYEKALDRFNKSSTQQNTELVTYLKEITKDSVIATEDTKSVGVYAAEDAKVMPDTVYRLETYDISTNSTITQRLNPPGKFIGLTRDELVELLSEEMKNMPLEEYQKGLVSYALISFSKDEIVLRKCYNPEVVQYKYYLAIYDGEVIVYYSDKKTIYDHTGIQAEYLSEKAKAELAVGKYVKDEAELYSLLESYSS